MCAAFESLGKQLRPGKPIGVWRANGLQWILWGGFARAERMHWWKEKGFLPVDVPASRFAERSRRDGRLHWADVPAGLVIRGLWDTNHAIPQVLIVTRSATVMEQFSFGHDRMPLLENPLYSSNPISPDPAVDGKPKQMDLF